MNIPIKFIDSFVKATERSAYGASLYKGKNDKIAADQAAVDGMSKQLNLINIKGKFAALAAFESVSLSPIIIVFFMLPPITSIVSVKCLGSGLL